MDAISLKQISGLPLFLDDSGRLTFGQDLCIEEILYRRVDELTAVAMTPEECQGNPETAYWMYNGVYLRSDQAALEKIPLRYELTYLPARTLGGEFIKTHGHRHYPEAKSGMQYAEICEVLYGIAHFIFKKSINDQPLVSSVFYIEAYPGEKVLFPPGLDHCTINPADSPLLFSDVIARGVKGDYSYFRKNQGAAYWEVQTASETSFIPNPRYGDVPPIVKRPVHCYPEFSITKEIPLYQAFLETYGRGWEFLLDPGLFRSTFPDLVESFSHP